MTEDHDLDFGDGRSLLSFITQIIDWFDVYLRGAPMETDHKPVQLYDPGADLWIERDSLWPCSWSSPMAWHTSCATVQ